MTSQTESRELASAEPVAKLEQFPLARLGSVYSLTLDEFQNTLCEQGKNFGSMNMDEFLSNIWTVEENQAMAAAMEAVQSTHGEEGDKPLIRQSSLPRQGSLTLPSPLCRKTVDEIWADIHKEQPQQQQQQQQQQPNNNNSGNAQRQTTFGEMTLEDFLIRAGVVRDAPSVAQPYELFRNGNAVETDYSAGEAPGYGHVLAVGFSDRNTSSGEMGGISRYPLAHHHQQQQQQQQQMLPGEVPGFGPNGKRVGNNGGLGGLCFGGGMGNCGIPVGGMGNGGFGPQPLAIGSSSPVSPVSSDGICTSQVNNSVISSAPYGMEMGMRGRKRILDGPVEKVVERRQRRMIKNRESAARSRARKQAYTVELEAELNQLKEENNKLKEQQEQEREKRSKKILEAMTPVVQPEDHKNRALKRTWTGPW